MAPPLMKVKKKAPPKSGAFYLEPQTKPFFLLAFALTLCGQKLAEKKEKPRTILGEPLQLKYVSKQPPGIKPAGLIDGESSNSGPNNTRRD